GMVAEQFGIAGRVHGLALVARTAAQREGRRRGGRDSGWRQGASRAIRDAGSARRPAINGRPAEESTVNRAKDNERVHLSTRVYPAFFCRPAIMRVSENGLVWLSPPNLLSRNQLKRLYAWLRHTRPF